jgi:Tfp pilus assembly protein PilX
MSTKYPRPNDQGFTLPTALGMGFILMLVTAAMLEGARSEQISATSRARSELSLAVAEAGITRFQAFLNQQRLLVTRNLSNWQSDLTTLESTVGNCVQKNTAQTYNQGDWLDLPTGKYRLRNYSYQPQPDSNGQIGISKLQIEGQTTTKPSQASSLIAVEMPVSLIPTNLPALWTTELNLHKEQKITGNVRVRTCPTNNGQVAGVSAENIAIGTNGQASGSITASIFPWPQARPIPYRNIDLPMIQGNLTLPRPGDWPDEKGVYHYAVQSNSNDTSIDLPAGKKLTVKLKNNEAVNLYTKGNISIGGQILAIDEATKAPQPQKLRIYGGADTTEFLLFDSATVTALIHAPLANGKGYSATKMGKGLTGILWLKSWNSSNHNSRLSIVQAGSWADLEIPPEEQLGVRIHPPSSWQRRDLSKLSSG